MHQSSTQEQLQRLDCGKIALSMTRLILEYDNQQEFVFAIQKLVQHFTGASVVSLLVQNGPQVRLASAIGPLREQLTVEQYNRKDRVPKLVAAIQRIQQHVFLAKPEASSEETEDKETASPQGDFLDQFDTIYTPLCNDGQAYTLLAVHLDAEDYKSLQLWVEILGLIAARSEAWFENQRLAEAEEERNVLLKERESFTRINQNIERKKFAYDLVNELQILSGCDRVAFLTFQSGHSKPIAFSGQPVFDKRSNSVRRLTSLVNVALRSGRPFWSDDTETIAPQLTKPLDTYREESHVMSLAIFPLVVSSPATNPTYRDRMEEMVNEGNPKNERTIGAVVLEQMEQELDRQSLDSMWERIEPRIVDAANNSQRHHSIFLMPFWLLLGQFFGLYFGSTRKKAIAITAAIAAGIALLLFYPSELLIRCEGVIQPRDLQHIFAREDGSVEGIMVADGQQVEQGQLLMLQENLKLEEQRVEARGELVRLLTERKTLRDDLVSMRLEETPEDKDKEAEVTSKLNEIDAAIDVQKELLALAENRMQSLGVRAVHPGVVFAWNVQRRFGERPVSVGDKLFSIANVEGPWELELKVPDKRAGYVMQAWRQSVEKEQPLEITYVCASNPNELMEGEVCHVPENLEVGSNDEAILPIKAALSRDATLHIKPKTSVVAKIHCGRCSLGYAKLYEFFDWVQRTWFEFVY